MGLKHPPPVRTSHHSSAPITTSVWQVGDPFACDTDQGPQIDADQFFKIMTYIDHGREQGARLVAGGSRHGERGYFVQPTVFADVTDDMKIAQEEIFGGSGSAMQGHYVRAGVLVCVVTSPERSFG